MPDALEENEQRERYRELLEELRTILPGIQVLFAFLLIAPFSARFEKLDHVGQLIYTAALVLTAMSTFMFIAPAAHHRLSDQSRLERLQWAVRLQVSGLTSLAAAMTLAVFVVTRFVFDTPWGLAVAVVVAAAGGLLWYVIPITRRVRGRAG